MIRPLPKLGMRIVKSAVAVFLCFVIYMIRGRGVPFYSAIAAVLDVYKRQDFMLYFLYI